MGSVGKVVGSQGTPTPTSTTTDNTNTALDDFRKSSVADAAKFAVDAYQDTKSHSSTYTKQGMNPQNTLQGVVEKLGLHGKPVVLSDADYDKQWKANALDGVQVYRGLGSDYMGDKYQQQFLYGDKTFISDGIHGEGIYMSTRRHEAANYASGNKSKTTVTGFIDKSKAKVITESALKSALAKESPSVRSAFKELGAYALYLGYNVVHCPGGNLGSPYTHGNGGSDFYLPLTRDILVMREHTTIH